MPRRPFRGIQRPALTQLALLAILASGCNESTPTAETTGGASGTGASRDGGAASQDASGERSTEVSSRDIEALERPDEVAALRLTPVPERARRRARALNAQGLRLYGRRQYRAAIGKYQAALREDPGHILARYNLSCAYNLVGEPELGLALLVEFKKADCAACRERLVRASEDADWHSMWDHPLFVEIVGVQVGSAEREKPFWQRGAKACPAGARLEGAAPPAGREVYCARGKTRIGAYVRWSASGERMAESGQYDRGQRTGVWKRFDDKGVLRETGPYRASKKHGVWSEWHPGGAQAVDGRFVDGVKHGRWTWFDTEGTILRQVDYDRGRRGTWIVAPK